MGRRVGRLALCVLLLAAGLALVRSVASSTGPVSKDGAVLSAGSAPAATVASPQHVAATLPALASLLVLGAAGLVPVLSRRPGGIRWRPTAFGRAPPLLAR